AVGPARAGRRGGRVGVRPLRRMPRPGRRPVPARADHGGGRPGPPGGAAGMNLLESVVTGGSFGDRIRGRWRAEDGNDLWLVEEVVETLLAGRPSADVPPPHTPTPDQFESAFRELRPERPGTVPWARDCLAALEGWALAEVRGLGRSLPPGSAVEAR